MWHDSRKLDKMCVVCLRRWGVWAERVKSSWSCVTSFVLQLKRIRVAELGEVWCWKLWFSVEFITPFSSIYISAFAFLHRTVAENSEVSAEADASTWTQLNHSENGGWTSFWNKETFNHHNVQKCTIMRATDFTTLRKPDDILVTV